MGEVSIRPLAASSPRTGGPLGQGRVVGTSYKRLTGSIRRTRNPRIGILSDFPRGKPHPARGDPEGIQSTEALLGRMDEGSTRPSRQLGGTRRALQS